MFRPGVNVASNRFDAVSPLPLSFIWMICDLYHVVLSEVEPAILDVVMKHVEGNQTEAAEVLGVSRGTLRKKLKLYGL
jgi:DNA-binding NtrC family response regulator